VDPGRALDILLEAGERAHGLSAHDEAARHFGAALLLIRNGRRSELMAYVLERLGESWEPVGETAAAMEVWTEALGECARAADSLGAARLHRRLAMAARSLGDMDSARRHLAAGVDTLRDLPPSEELVDLCHARLEVDSPIADPDRAQDAVAELGRLAKILATPRAAAEVLLAEAQLAWARGDYAVSRGRAEEAVRVAEEASEWLLARRAHRELAWLGWVFGHPDAIRLHAHSQLEIDRRLGAPVNESIPQMQLGVAALLIGDWDEATWLVEEAVADARRYEERRALTMCLGVLAMVRILRGDVDAAEECLAEARQVFPDFAADPRGGLYLLRMPEAMLALERGDAPGTQVAAAVLRTPVAQAWVGTAQVLGGDLDDALATAAILAADGPPGSYPAALADRVVGLVEHARGETEAARMHLDRSTETLATLRLPFEAAVSQLHTGTVESARLALATFEALGAARYADRARRVLRGLGVRLPSARSGRGPDQRLSRRELEVARLVAEGLSNAEIAERLVLSVRTVGSHLDHIYGRLGISSRVALARWLTTAESPSAT
jgi:DNA-binding CsgD family transcriptional regulator/tetratricopeptide (TPR) repeat protein